MTKFEEVSALEFYTYLEDIKNKLANEVPQWKVEIKVAGQPPQTFYHLGQWDFTNGKVEKPFFQGIFAYHLEDRHYILNHHPLNQI